MVRAKKTPAVLERGVEWTEEMRGAVWSWRGHVNPKFQHDDLEETRDLEAAHAKRIGYASQDFANRVGGRRFDERLEAGLAHVDGRLRAMSRAALDVAKNERKVPASIDEDVEVALVALEMVPAFAGMPYWIAKAGLPFAIRTLVSCHLHWSSAREHGRGREIWIVNDDTCVGSTPRYADSPWRLLRAALAEADDATYDEALRTAQEIRKTAHSVIRSLLAFAFTTEREWADEAARDVLARTKQSCGHEKLLVTVASLELAAEVAKMPWEYSEGELFTVLAREGAAGARVVAAALDSASNNTFRKRYAQVLSTIAHDEAASAFARYIANRTVGPLAMKHFARHPEIARRVLEPLSHGASMQARSAAIALRSLP